LIVVYLIEAFIFDTTLPVHGVRVEGGALDHEVAETLAIWTGADKLLVDPEELVVTIRVFWFRADFLL